MRTALSLLRPIVLTLLLGGLPAARGDDKSASVDLGEIRPPGGAPLRLTEPGRREINVERLNRVKQRLESAPAQALDKWVAELERIMGQKLEGDLAKQACRTYFVTHMSLAFDDLTWNAKRADRLFERAKTLSASDAKLWKDAFEKVLGKEIGQTANTNLDGGPAYAIPLVLIPLDVLFEGEKYRAERAEKYLTRLKQLTSTDLALWMDKVDTFGGTRLDAAVNIILLDPFFGMEEFVQEEFQAVIEARKKST